MATVRMQEDVPVVGRCSKPTLQLLPWTLLVLLAHLELGECLAECFISLWGLSVALAEGALQQRGSGSQEKGKQAERAEQAVLSCAGSMRIGGVI